jgi:uncharacterized protein
MSSAYPIGPAEEAGAQDGAIAFLSAPGTFAPSQAPIERHDTHGAYVFVAGDHAIKIKRAVRYSYFDFSTVEKRRVALEREFEINKGNAREIYLDVVAITSGPDGRLRFGGDGKAIEWCLRMRRFEQAALLSHMAQQGIADDVLKALADEVHRSHRDAPVAKADSVSAIAGLAGIIEEIAGALEQEEGLAAEATHLRKRALTLLLGNSRLLERRASTGKIRRCHGDLHLNNIVMWNGRPALFDALEFDEALATIDTLYDLAFLLMDLDIQASRTAANLVLNRYLWRAQDVGDLEGLALLPLFLALRVGVRAMVAWQRSHLVAAAQQASCTQEGRRYLDAALGYLDPPQPRLVAVGGYSGTGKSTLAAALAPMTGAAPGALHLRSDLERKAMHGVDEFKRLDDAAYSPAGSAHVYDMLAAKARLALAAGHAVIADAVFLAPAERSAIEDVARGAGAPFNGLWLQAAPDQLRQRVETRTGDASDATSVVVERQVRQGAGEVGWAIIDASGTPGELVSRAGEVLLKS